MPQSHPPSIETIVADSGLSSAVAAHGRPVVTEIVRTVVERLRGEIRSGGGWLSADEIITRVNALLAQRTLQFPQRVVNATGVLIHTNLGRVPWGPELLCEISPRLTSYISLEYDIAEGIRGKRGIAVEAELAALTGAEGAMVVNNNAAAVYLVLSALAWNREVVISRGELVQIGGGFRIPEILAKSGAILREIGTTNQTSLADYDKACGPQAALILKVHRSNFVQTGFVSEVDPKSLAALGKKKGIPVVWDVGSGAVGPGAVCEFSGEPTLRACVGSGVDLVTSSGDKLFGGPQAGFVLGRRDLLNRLHSDPFYRALRPDKATLLALELTTRAHRSGKSAELVPLYKLLSVLSSRLKERAEAMAERARAHGHRASVVATADTFGGGAAPGKTIDGWGVRIDAPPSPEELSARARAFSPPIIATVSDNGMVFSLRTMFDGDDSALTDFLS
jgi:L-seryl-tRNA(Ser) seleniumtransferase